MFRASPIGPVAGGILAFFVLLGVTGWGYRQWARSDRRLLVNNSDQDRVIMDGSEEDAPDSSPVNSAGHNNFGLTHNSISVMSPYRMNPSYRRPRPGHGPDSDPGYSTMTPCGDQDSEIMSCLGSTVNTRLKRDMFKSHNNPLSQQSVTSGVSSRSPSPDHIREERDELSEMKKLGNNQILVAATIHSVET